MEGEHQCEGEALQSLLERKAGSFRLIPNGIPGVETRLPLLYTGALAAGRITPQKFVELTSTNPAKLVSRLFPKLTDYRLTSYSMVYTLEKAQYCLDPMQTW